MPHSNSDFLHGCAEIADFLGISRRRAYYLLERGLIPAAKSGDVDERMNRWLQHLTAEASFVGSLRGRVIVPTYGEWRAACAEHPGCSKVRGCRKTFGRSLPRLVLYVSRKPKLTSLNLV